MVTPAIREVEVSRDGQIVATLRHGQEPDIHSGPHAQDLRQRLALPRFVRRPDTKELRWYPNQVPDDSPEWWLAHAGDALWDKYTLTLPERRQ